jgi:hypothetical protein
MASWGHSPENFSVARGYQEHSGSFLDKFHVAAERIQARVK